MPAHAQPQFVGDWAVAHAQTAPWVVPTERTAIRPNPELQTARISIRTNGLTGPRLLACPGRPAKQFTVPAEGLFEGGLNDPHAAPARQAAIRLGFPPGPIPTLETPCHAIRLHLSAPDQAQFAVDNVIYTLVKTTP